MRAHQEQGCKQRSNTMLGEPAASECHDCALAYLDGTHEQCSVESIGQFAGDARKNHVRKYEESIPEIRQ
jgi:hypothetical protein